MKEIVRKYIRESINNFFEVEDKTDSVLDMDPTQQKEKIEQIQSEIEKYEQELDRTQNNLKSFVIPKMDVLTKTKNVGVGATNQIARRDKENKQDEFKYYKEEIARQQERVKELQDMINQKNDELNQVQSIKTKTTKEVQKTPTPPDVPSV